MIEQRTFSASSIASLRHFRPGLTGMLTCFLMLAVTAALEAADARDAKPTKEGKSARSRPAPSGSLVIVGGGGLPDAVRDRFLELAGGKRAKLVIIPTASETAHKKGQFRSFDYWKTQPAASVLLLHTLDREKANDAAFVKPLTEATGVWKGGGDQSRLISAYHGTLVERELRRLMARGGVVGGTSAGASAMSSLMIVSGNPDAKVGEGLGLIDVVIDQHFQNRNRLKRLQGVLEKHPGYLGVGIDEETALVVSGHKAKVLGKANVRVCMPKAVQKMPGVQVLKAGDEIDLDPLRQAVQARRK